MIRFAKKNEPAHFVKEITELTYEILKDLGIDVLQHQSQRNIVNFLEELFYEIDNRFSYHNMLVKESEGHIIGIAIIYHGKDAEEFDGNFANHLQQKYGTDYVEISKETEKDEFYLDSLAVSPNHRKKGIGSELLKAFEDLGHQKEYHKLSLNVEEDNTNALRLYTKSGFEYQSTFNLYGHPYLHLVKLMGKTKW